MSQCSVHKYKYSQSKRFNRLKRMRKDGILKKIKETKTHVFYAIVDVGRYKARAK